LLHCTTTSSSGFPLSIIPYSSLLLPGPNPTITTAWVQDVIRLYARDDFFQASFLDIVIFSGTQASDSALTKEADEHLKKLGNRYIVGVAELNLLPGPYALVGNEMRDMWKIADDSFGTCITTL
jgi:hypothetical protein